MRARFATDLNCQLENSLALNSKLFFLLNLIKSDFNGLNGLKFSGELLSIKVTSLSETSLSIIAWFKSEVSYEEPEYFDIDSEEFSESFGSNNISYYTIKRETLIKDTSIKIPNYLLYLSKEELRLKLSELFKDWTEAIEKAELSLNIKSTELLLDEARKALSLLEN